MIGHFLALAILWITREMGGMYGWSALFPQKYDYEPFFILCIHAYAMIVSFSVVKIEVFLRKTMIIFIFLPEQMWWVHTECQQSHCGGPNEVPQSMFIERKMTTQSSTYRIQMI